MLLMCDPIQLVKAMSNSLSDVLFVYLVFSVKSREKWNSQTVGTCLIIKSIMFRNDYNIIWINIWKRFENSNGSKNLNIYVFLRLNYYFITDVLMKVSAISKKIETRFSNPYLFRKKTPPHTPLCECSSKWIRNARKWFLIRDCFDASEEKKRNRHCPRLRSRHFWSSVTFLSLSVAKTYVS